MIKNKDVKISKFLQTGRKNDLSFDLSHLYCLLKINSNSSIIFKTKKKKTFFNENVQETMIIMKIRILFGRKIT